MLPCRSQSWLLENGQGAIVAAAYGHPGCLEQVLAARNVQLEELPELAQSWGNVSGILVEEPRLSKSEIQPTALRASAPQLFEAYPVPSRRTIPGKATECFIICAPSSSLKLLASRWRRRLTVSNLEY